MIIVRDKHLNKIGDLVLKGWLNHGDGYLTGSYDLERILREQLRRAITGLVCEEVNKNKVQYKPTIDKKVKAEFDYQIECIIRDHLEETVREQVKEQLKDKIAGYPAFIKDIVTEINQIQVRPND